VTNIYSRTPTHKLITVHLRRTVKRYDLKKIRSSQRYATVVNNGKFSKFRLLATRAITVTAISFRLVVKKSNAQVPGCFVCAILCLAAFVKTDNAKKHGTMGKSQYMLLGRLAQHRRKNAKTKLYFCNNLEPHLDSHERWQYYICR
jgi:hypothetical protein